MGSSQWGHGEITVEVGSQRKMAGLLRPLRPLSLTQDEGQWKMAGEIAEGILGLV